MQPSTVYSDYRLTGLFCFLFLFYFVRKLFRKRKFKRIAVDVEMPASHSRFSCVVHQQKKKRIVGISSDHRGRGNVEGGR